MTLLDLLEALPDGALLPVGWVRSKLQAEADDQEGEGEGGPELLRVPALAERFDRAESTIRSWCRDGRLEGAYRLRGREWVVPADAVEVFEEEQREGDEEPQRVGRGPAVDLGAWRDSREDTDGEREQPRGP
jgi:hypothetical protein